MARVPQDPPGFIVGQFYRTPDGPALFLGLATYEVERLGIHAGRRRYIWIEPLTKVACAIEGPLAFELRTIAGDLRATGLIRGYRRDELPAIPQEVTVR